MKGQMDLFSYADNIKQKTVEDIHAEKPWIRLCRGHENECFEHPENGICESYYKCSKRKEYKTLNQYYLEQLDGRHTLNNPIDGTRILCDGNKAEADELIRKTKEYYGWE